MVESDIVFIKSYIDEYLFEPSSDNDKYTFDQNSYSMFAANEILVLAMEELMKPPACVSGKMSKSLIELLEEFAFDMECYSEKKTEWRFQKMFVIGKSVAEDIMQHYIYERGNRHEKS